MQPKDPSEHPEFPSSAGGIRAQDYADLIIRPVRPSDADELRAAYENWSEQSRYLRFHTGMKHLPQHLLDYLTHVDGVDHVALVATLPRAPYAGVGIGRFVRLPHGSNRAELALAVSDGAQGHGVAARLLGELAELAAERGIETFVMEVLGSNAHVRELLASVGAQCVRCEEGVLSYELPLSTLRASAAHAPG